jgi:hypothetical protein
MPSVEECEADIQRMLQSHDAQSEYERRSAGVPERQALTREQVYGTQQAESDAHDRMTFDAIALGTERAVHRWMELHAGDIANAMAAMILRQKRKQEADAKT